MKATAGAEAAMEWCGGDDGTETALPAMRASSLASFDEEGLELDDRCCTISSPAADEPDIATDCARAGSRAPKLLEEGTKTARARHFLSSSPHDGARSRAGGRDLSQNPSRTCHGRRRSEADAASGMLRAGGDRPRRAWSQPPASFPLCCLLTRWSPLLSTARRRRLELTPRGARGGRAEPLA
jgi:hypothetical protein